MWQYQPARHHWHTRCRSCFPVAVLRCHDQWRRSKHFIYSLNVDTGAINPGWPVDVNATATYNGMTFTSLVQNQRAALGLVNGVVYVPYSGHFGDAVRITDGLSACQSTIPLA